VPRSSGAQPPMISHSSWEHGVALGARAGEERPLSSASGAERKSGHLSDLLCDRRVLLQGRERDQETTLLGSYTVSYLIMKSVTDGKDAALL